MPASLRSDYPKIDPILLATFRPDPVAIFTGIHNRQFDWPVSGILGEIQKDKIIWFDSAIARGGQNLWYGGLSKLISDQIGNPFINERAQKSIYSQLQLDEADWCFLVSFSRLLLDDQREQDLGRHLTSTG